MKIGGTLSSVEWVALQSLSLGLRGQAAPESHVQLGLRTPLVGMRVRAYSVPETSVDIRAVLVLIERVREPTSA